MNASVTTRERRDGYTIVRCAESPSYWFGNCLVLDVAPDVERYGDWIAEHARAFAGIPIRRHVIVWETAGATGLEPYAGPAERDRSTILVMRRAPTRSVPWSTLHELASEADWADAAALDATHRATLGEEIATFGRWYFDVVRGDARAGRCTVWGARDRGALVAFAGLYADDRWARFSTPVTAAAYRRRGLFGALASALVARTLRRRPRATVVIAAETGSPQERTYRNLGFEAVGEQRALVVKPAAGRATAS